MTLDINEAKNILKENMDELVKNPLVTVDEILVKANDIAIKSLEAWESLREELKYELCKKVHEKDSCIPCPNQTTSCSYTGLRIYELNNIINHVIDKHLSEVSE